MQRTQEPHGLLRNQRGGAKILVLLVIFGVLVLGIGYMAAKWFDIPKKLGIGVTATKVLSGAPDRAAAQQIAQPLQSSGYNTKGTEVYVLPVTGSDHQVAVVVLDESQGFNLSKSKSGDPVKDFANALANSPAGANFSTAAVVYRDANGKELGTIAVSTADLKAYAAGTMTREQLGATLGVGINKSQLLSVLKQQGLGQ